ncbi:hypothetical protein KC343_g1845 [Hortaea werneckii]|nr:hypothetical protein KC352_g6913 [Hortaea werneckii]KAI7294078.1 hypothetical protein KC340_g16285 [Hortaea werneckii]KAI7379327.1 hypothetical protein KC328_g13411 [Hortaea werneckii]KAI7570928.1 hypothetical protein KC317_g2055 [Hortaea werneckii]KAI7625615.1 hypothetical protein KC346_g1643 [Hortaea werneckii]
MPATYNVERSHTGEDLSVAREQAKIVFAPAKGGATPATLPARPKLQPHTPLISTPSLTPDDSDSDSDSDSESSGGSDIMGESNRQAMAAANSSWKALRVESSGDEDYFGLARSSSFLKKPKLGKEGKAWRQQWMGTTLLAGRNVLKRVQIQGKQQITTEKQAPFKKTAWNEITHDGSDGQSRQRRGKPSVKGWHRQPKADLRHGTGNHQMQRIRDVHRTNLRGPGTASAWAWAEPSGSSSLRSYFASLDESRRTLHHDVRLEEAQEGCIAHDIQVFYEEKFSKIREARSLDFNHLAAQWPGSENICLLVDKAVPLFIFAFTVCRFIQDDPQRRLNIVLRESSGRSLLGLKGTYLPILKSVVDSDDGEAKVRIFDFKRIAGTIVLLFDPLTASALAHLLNLCIGDIDRALRPLHSVLNIPRVQDGRMDCTAPIMLFHLSFRDFLVDPALKNENEFWVNAKETHRTLGSLCIQLLASGGLKEDVCGVVAPEDVAYACRYWVQHVVSSGEQIKDGGVELWFLQKHMLHWMEAMSWLGKTSDVIYNIAALRSVVDLNEGKQLLNVLDDASRFTLRNRFIVNEAPLQKYLSGLLFAPSLSNIRQTYRDSLQRYFDVTPSVLARLGAERQKLEGHDDFVRAVALSPDGKTVASASSDKTVRLWDAATGEERQKHQASSRVSRIAFSSDGTGLEMDVGHINIGTVLGTHEVLVTKP